MVKNLVTVRRCEDDDDSQMMSGQIVRGSDDKDGMMISGQSVGSFDDGGESD